MPAVINAINDALAPLGVTITRLPSQPGVHRVATGRGEPMKPATFEYHRPDTVEDAVSLLAELGEDAKILAGGQSLVPMLAMRLAYFDHLIDTSRLSELRGIDRRGQELWIGAGTTEATVGADEQVRQAVPLLTRVTPFVGHFQIRNRGTLGGSIAHADAAGEYPAVALTLDAVIEVLSRRGRAGDRRGGLLHRFVGNHDGFR